MLIESVRVFDIVVLRLDGQFIDEIELASNIGFFEKEKAPKVLINFENVGNINSYCFRSLARIHQLLITNGGDMRICSLKPAVRQIFGIANLDRGYHIYTSEDEGIIGFYNNLPTLDSFNTGIIYSS